MEHPFWAGARDLAGGSLNAAQVDLLNKVVDELEPDSKEHKISDSGINLIKGFEGLELKAYQDSVKIWTIGHGTIKYPNGKAVAKGDTCTAAQAVEYMRHDLKGFEAKVNDVVKVPLTQNQYDALVSLTYNIGQTAFANSTLLKKLNAKDYKGAAEQFLVWNKAGGRVIQGLVNRRAAEKKVFETK
jgi:lysozyme